MIKDIFINLITNNNVFFQCDDFEEATKVINFLKKEVGVYSLYNEKIDESEQFPIFILIDEDENGKGYNIIEEEDLENYYLQEHFDLTYFAKKYFKGVEFIDNLQLTSDEERNFLNCALEMYRGYKIEYYDEKNETWKLEKPDVIKSKYIYRTHVTRKPTPLKIPESILKVLNPKWKWFAMDGKGIVWCFDSKPKINYSSKSWFGEKFWDDYLDEYIYLNDYMNISRVISINTDGIVWDYSLTERPTK